MWIWHCLKDLFSIWTKSRRIFQSYLWLLVIFYLDLDLRLSLTGAELVGLATGKDLISMVSEELQIKKNYFNFLQKNPQLPWKMSLIKFSLVSIKMVANPITKVAESNSQKSCLKFCGSDMCWQLTWQKTPTPSFLSCSGQLKARPSRQGTDPRMRESHRQKQKRFPGQLSWRPSIGGGRTIQHPEILWGLCGLNRNDRGRRSQLVYQKIAH